MNYGQLQEHLAKRILRRDDINADPELYALAINAGHTQLMMDGDFRCMETHTSIVYPNATDLYGIAMPLVYSAGPPVTLSCKRIRNVWNTSGVTFAGNTPTGTPVATTPIIPSTEDESNNIRNIANQTRQITPTSTNYQQRWYEKQQQICLLYPPAATTPATAVSLIADYYGILPDYAIATDSDYFSQQYYMALLMCAAWVGSTSLWEDDRAGRFQADYQKLLIQAITIDARIKQGGASREIVAPVSTTVNKTGGQ